MQELVNDAPKLLDYLGDESRAHFDGVQRLLNANNIRFTINPRLVRGMDYYNRTVFEWITDHLGSQGTVCGGGRYDPLVEIFGGKPTPAVGFAMGVERLLELMRANTPSTIAGQCDVYLVHQGDAAQVQAFILGERLRDAGLDVVLHCAALGGAGSFKSQMKRADGSGAAYALILGDDEMAKGEATIKHLREADMTNNQRHIGFDQVVDYLIDQIVGDAEHEHGHLHAGQIPTHH
jgi:histidyl-tRNA synthetase